MGRGAARAPCLGVSRALLDTKTPIAGVPGGSGWSVMEGIKAITSNGWPDVTEFGHPYHPIEKQVHDTVGQFPVVSHKVAQEPIAA
ncbi:hypothetical protein Aple_006300 [Acrocarpospora pleiomorpha]|uniref:Uncharacterized protein n=1 Tax=Acrocarpospora pleiomorpha TaxID=90975 RepID=A0A5M3X7T5_9ACTN|nr:hypothetical protein Aple_006300 [Acrocarpospora pleiomorpha]